VDIKAKLITLESNDNTLLTESAMITYPF